MKTALCLSLLLVSSRASLARAETPPRRPVASLHANAGLGVGSLRGQFTVAARTSVMGTYWLKPNVGLGLDGSLFSQTNASVSHTHSALALVAHLRPRFHRPLLVVLGAGAHSGWNIQTSADHHFEDSVNAYFMARLGYLAQENPVELGPVLAFDLTPTQGGVASSVCLGFEIGFPMLKRAKPAE